jgi:MtfA peptidase
MGMSETALVSAWPVIFFTLAVALGVLRLMAQPWLVARRRRRQSGPAFPAAWRRILRRRVPLVARLPTHLQLRLKRHIQVFIAEKPFIGCQGQEITDEVRVTIAAQACLLLLGHERPEFYPRLKEILVYPGAFVVEREQAVGVGVGVGAGVNVVRDQRQALSGESWSQGRVVLSWADAVAGAADPHDARNVVVHEFAHQIDQDDGSANGRPWRATPQARRRWQQVMDAAFARLQNTPSEVIDAYGATDPAEFFAVVSEVFFERPAELAAEAPEVYREFSALYGLNPAQW